MIFIFWVDIFGLVFWLLLRGGFCSLGGGGGGVVKRRLVKKEVKGDEKSEKTSAFLNLVYMYVHI